MQRGHLLGRLFFFLSFILAIISFSESQSALAQGPPYPASPIVESVSWDLANLQRAAPGSDLWPLTWADDGHLYTSWGDGGGFGGTNSDGRVRLGVARVEGSGQDWQGINVFGGKSPEVPATFEGKAHGIISIDGTLYMVVTEQGKWMRGKIGRSTDHGRTWTFNSGTFQQSDWDFAEPGGAFAAPAILQFGQGYQGARDDYVYLYSEKVRGTLQPDILLARVLKTQIMNRSAYEFFVGLDGSDAPLWTTDINQAGPVFSDPNGVEWGLQATYHPVLDRYLLTVRHNNTGGWGIFDAPEPWGPWTTVAYYDHWIDSTFKFMFSLNQKWMSPDGKTMWMVFSGTNAYDSFNVVKASLNLGSSGTPQPTDSPTPQPTNSPTPQPTNSPTPVPPSTDADIKINFQPAEATVPAGYLADDGAAYGDRGNGYIYGWLGGSNNAGRTRNTHPDQRYNTLNHLQKSGDHIWEIALADGTYTVNLVMGDPSYTNQENNVDIEGVILNDPDGQDNFDEYRNVAVMVSDGKLSIQPAPGASNAKVNFIEISASSPMPTPTSTPTSEPTPSILSLVLDGPTSVTPGETFGVNVVAQNVPSPGLYGVQFEINYDPALISASNLQVNSNLSFVVLNSADNTTGKIRLVASQQGQVPGLTGDVTLLSFEATAANTPGSVTLGFENVKLSDAQAQGFEVDSKDYSVSITETTTPEPTTTPVPPTTTPAPTSEPTATPIPPTTTPTPEPTSEPTATPTPTPEPTNEPTPQPTSEPMMADVSGQVIVVGRADNDWSGTIVTIDGNGKSDMTDVTGNFSITEVAAESSSSITADAAGYLSAMCDEITIDSPETVLSSVNLLSGDINDDDLVDITDATAVGAGFGQTGSDLPADITRDTVLDIFDIVLVSVNFGEQGPQTWDCLAN